jgi:TonB dependent receptor-like, beta-barrel
LNEARMQFARGNESQIADSDGPQIRIGSMRTGITFGRRDVFPGRLREQRWQWIDNITLVRGAHEIKMGAELDRVTDRNASLTAASGSYQFNNLRDFVNGRYMSYTQGFGVPEDTTVSPYYAAFIQDNLKWGSTFSINAGVRYEFNKLQPTSTVNPQFARTGQVHQDKNNFAPRLAVAWQPRTGFVLRTSYGIYYGLLSVQANSTAKTQNGVVQTVREFRSNTPGAPVYPQVFTGSATLQSPTPGARITVFSPDFASPYIQQLNLEIEKGFSDDLSVTTGWFYTKGTKLRSNEDINLFPPGIRTVQINDTRRNIAGLITLPYFGGPASRPFSFFDQISEFRSDNNSVYHATFVQLNKRYSRGLQLLFNYTLSKLIDRGQAPGNQTTCCTSDNPFQVGSERGLGRRDQRQRMNLAAVLDLPSPAAGPFPRFLIRDWRLNTIVKVGSGRPFTATVTGDSGGDLNGDAVRGGDRAPFFGSNTFIGPGYATVDLGLHKIFSAEGKVLDVGFEAFNLLNRANYLRPATEYYQLTNVAGGISRLDGPLPSFGKPQDATRSREMQAVIKFSF